MADEKVAPSIEPENEVSKIISKLVTLNMDPILVIVNGLIIRLGMVLLL